VPGYSRRLAPHCWLTTPATARPAAWIGLPARSILEGRLPHHVRTPVTDYRAVLERSLQGRYTLERELGRGGMSFSPSQARILDVRDHRTLWVYGVDGGSRTKVFEFPDPDVRLDYPLWSPDGRWILFDRAAARGGDLWLVEGIE